MMTNPDRPTAHRLRDNVRSDRSACWRGPGCMRRCNAYSPRPTRCAPRCNSPTEATPPARLSRPETTAAGRLAPRLPPTESPRRIDPSPVGRTGRRPWMRQSWPRSPPAWSRPWTPSLRSAQFSGVVLVARDGDIVFAKGYGEADRAAGVPNDTQTRFRIGSITKPITAMIVLMLQERGLLKHRSTPSATMSIRARRRGPTSPSNRCCRTPPASPTSPKPRTSKRPST